MADYYAVLGLNRDADVQAIQKSYRNLAIKWHPLRCTDADAEMRFDEISEAFEVLSGYELRAVFDKFGEAGLKEGASDGSGGYFGGTYEYAGNGMDLFETFFGTSNPFASIIEVATAVDTAAPVTIDAGPVHTIFESITLEDVFSGASKIAGVNGRDVSFTVQPSHATGTVLVFQDDGTGPGEVRVVLQEEKHEFFKRDGADVHYITSMSVLDSLVGSSVEIKTLGGKMINIPVNDIVFPGYTKVVPGEGLPKESGGFGDLVLEFDIVFPKSLRPEQKMLLKAGLALPKQMTRVQTDALTATKNAFEL